MYNWQKREQTTDFFNWNQPLPEKKNYNQQKQRTPYTPTLAYPSLELDISPQKHTQITQKANKTFSKSTIFQPTTPQPPKIIKQQLNQSQINFQEVSPNQQVRTEKQKQRANQLNKSSIIFENDNTQKDNNIFKENKLFQQKKHIQMPETLEQAQICKRQLKTPDFKQKDLDAFDLFGQYVEKINKKAEIQDFQPKYNEMNAAERKFNFLHGNDHTYQQKKKERQEPSQEYNINHRKKKSSLILSTPIPQHAPEKDVIKQENIQQKSPSFQKINEKEIKHLKASQEWKQDNSNQVQRKQNHQYSDLFGLVSQLKTSGQKTREKKEQNQIKNIRNSKSNNITDKELIQIKFSCNDQIKNIEDLEIKQFCYKQGLHFVDFQQESQQYQKQKLNTLYEGTLKIRGDKQSLQSIENAKDFLRKKGVIIKT